MAVGGGASSSGLVYCISEMERACRGENPLCPCQVDGGSAYGPASDEHHCFLFGPGIGKPLVPLLSYFVPTAIEPW